MWEFLNIGHIMMGSMIAIFLIAIIVLEKGKAPGAIVFLFLVAIMIYFETKYEYNTAKNNIELFNKGKILLCSNITQNYNVSKKDNWKLHKYYFTNGIHSIRANMCKEY